MKTIITYRTDTEDLSVFQTRKLEEKREDSEIKKEKKAALQVSLSSKQISKD